METHSRFNRAIVSFGVPAGAASPNHDTDSYPGRPLSAIVGMSGRLGTRVVVDTPIANLIREAKTHQIPGMMQVGKKKGNQPLDDAIMDLLRKATISPEEAYEKSIDKKKFRVFLKNPPDDFED